MWAVHVATPGKPCAPGIWHPAHTLGGVWGPGSSRVSPRCGVDRKVAVREHRRGTRCSKPPHPDQLWRPRPPSLEPFALALHPIPATVRPPGPTRGGACSRGKATPSHSSPSAHSGEKKNPLAAAMFPAPKPTPDTAGRAPGTHRGKTRDVAGTLGRDSDFHGGHNLGEEPAANSSRRGEASNPVALVMRPSGLHPDWLLAQ